MNIKIILPGFSRIVKIIWLWFRKLYYSGNKYTCPVCSVKFRKMLPGGFDLPIIKEKEIIGSGLRKNNICPYCQSTDRDRLIYIYLEHIGFFQKKLKVLHISPEPSLYKVISKCKSIDYHIGTKYNEGIYYPKNIESIDLLNLPFNDNTFDFILCNHVLEHIHDDKRAISEIFRVLKYEGSAILQVPISLISDKTFEDIEIVSKKDREKYFGQFDHVRIYGNDYVKRLQDTGFTVIEYQPENQLIIKFALNPKEKLFIVRKP